VDRLTLALGVLLLAGCGSAPPEPVEPQPTTEAPPPEPETPFERVVALPGGMRTVIGLDLSELRGGPIYGLIRMAMDGDSPVNRTGQMLLERTDTVRLGMYGRQPQIVVIGRGARLEGAVDELVEELRGGARPPTPVDRLGFRAWYVDDDMVVCQVAPDAVLVTFPEQLNAVLRVAAGQQAATALPDEMEALLARPGLAGRPMWVVFRALRDRRGEPLDRLITEAGYAGGGAELRGARLHVTGTARAPSVERAAELRTELTEARQTEAGGGDLGDALRSAAIGGEGAWVEVELDVSTEQIDGLMELIDPTDR